MKIASYLFNLVSMGNQVDQLVYTAIFGSLDIFSQVYQSLAVL